MEYKAGIIFDGDDTLWETSIFYTEAKQNFFDEMSFLGFDPKEVERLFEKTDIANLKKLGFTKQRFPTSMADTYKYFCKQYGVESKREISNRLKAIGYSVFERKPLILDHAENVLKQLKPSYKLILATKGDLEIQRSKIEHSGLRSYFDNIYILSHKAEKEFNQIIQDNSLAKDKAWSVGNSLKSDIYPALKVGLGAVWIPHAETWEYENEPIPDSSKFFQVESLTDILKIIMRNTSNEF